jgi:alpha-mannosidase
MTQPKLIGILILAFGFCFAAVSQNEQVNFVSPKYGVTFDASSADLNPQFLGRPSNLAKDILQLRWEANNEKEGAWVSINWPKPQTIKELWIIGKAKPYDIVLDPYMRTANYLVPRKINLTFSDGSKQTAELRLCDDYQIITLPEAKTTQTIRIQVESVWEGSGKKNTGLCKVKAFAQSHEVGFQPHFFELYDVKNDQPVQSVKLEITNLGSSVSDALLQVSENGKEFCSIKLNVISENSVTMQQIWLPIVYTNQKLTFSIKTKSNRFPKSQLIEVKAYNKNYFDGGTMNIMMANHNDLGWLNTQAITADYRSNVLIAPALDMMKTNPDFKYMMESVEYLKEFLVRHPERKEELIQRMHEGRFTFGASYVQNLQVHVGQEKLIRQFYYGRRWLKENIPGYDTHYYINTDVPGFTYQMPQILKKSGIDYTIQGRLPWGFYYWQGLDGTSIPMFAFRYGDPNGLMNPKNNTGWMKFINEREYYYQPRQLPKTMLYDFNSDYLPPCKDILPFVETQNATMILFADKWNSHYKNTPEKQINPPKLKFVEPESALKEFFGNGELNIETIKGDWPLSWAYYDEPANREGLLAGRKACNMLTGAEGLFAAIKQVNPSANYPQNKFDEGWLANCWPDHGWGGNRGPVTDSFYVASYRKSEEIGGALVKTAQEQFLKFVPQPSKEQIPVVVYNPCNWERTELASCTVAYPENWKAFQLKDVHGNQVQFDLVSKSKNQSQAEIILLAGKIPSLGYQTYYASQANNFPENKTNIPADSIETELVKIKFGAGGIASYFDKITNQEILQTDKFFGGEVIQFTAPGTAWEKVQPVNMNDFDKTSQHEFKTISTVETPLRYIVEKEAKFSYFTLHERFILNKFSGELIVEADVLNWTGEKARELRIVFPVKLDRSFRASYEIPFGTVEMGRDEIDFSIFPENYECQFNPEKHGRKDLPYREAVNWVDVSSGEYQGKGCLFASDMTVHLFRDETANPVDYPVVQHVLLSSRESLAWNPEYSFTQAGSHSYRIALYPHKGGWRVAYKNGQAFNKPLIAFSGKGSGTTTFPTAQSFLKVEPSNIIVSAMKQAEDGKGTIVRLYEAEGKFTKAKISGFKPFSKVTLTDMIEYDEKGLPVNADGSINISVKPWEIVTLRVLL